MKTARSSWVALLGPQARAAAVDNAVGIFDALLNEERLHALPMGLPGGLAGVALSYDYAARVLDREDYRRRAREAWASAVDALEQYPSSAGLHGGFTGLAWVTRQMADTLESTDSSMFQEIETELLALADGSEVLDFDLISGWVGWGVYGLEATENPASADLVRAVLRLLDQNKRAEKTGIAWHTNPANLMAHQLELTPNGRYDLGLAHGNPGVVAFLARAAREGFEAAEPLLEPAVDWLLALGQQASPGRSYPSWFSADRSVGGRTAWCYGELGVGVAFTMAGEALGREDVVARGVELMIRSASLSMPESAVVDTGLCHGAAGVAHCLNRVGQFLREESLLQLARVWMGRTQAMRVADRGIEGHASWGPANPGATGSPELSRGEWQWNPNFLTGALGVAVVMLAACFDVEPEWDRCLLLPRAKVLH